jgi:hypothetical protein
MRIARRDAEDGRLQREAVLYCVHQREPAAQSELATSAVHNAL